MVQLFRLRRAAGWALVLAVAAYEIPTAHAQPKMGQVLPEQLKGVWLVGVRTLDAQELGNATRSTQQIIQVYSGPGLLLNQRFTVISANQTGAARIDPPPVKGETGIWAVSRTPSGIKAELGPKIYGLNLPARMGVTGRGASGDFSSYDNALQLALAVEKLAPLGRPEAEELLRGYVSNSVPETSAWAIGVLGTVMDVHDQETFFKPLVEKAEVPLLGQLAADAQIMRLNPQWQASEARSTLLNRWVTGPLEGRGLLDLLTWLRQTDSISEETRVKLLAEVVKRPAHTRETFETTVNQIAQAAIEKKSPTIGNILVDNINTTGLDWRQLIFKGLMGVPLAEDRVQFLRMQRLISSNSVLAAQIASVITSVPGRSAEIIR